MVNILVVQHEDDCPPALFGIWLAEAGCTLHVCRPYAGESLPDVTAYDGLLVLGGPMGANDDATCAWLTPLKELVRTAHAHSIATLGICLGHQVIAVALGGTVVRNPRGQQVGLLDVGWTAAAIDDDLFAGVATPRRGVQWNDDIVSVLPEGSVALGATPDGELQVARFARRMWGVQLHPEVDGQILRLWSIATEALSEASDAVSKDEHEAPRAAQEALLREVDSAAEELRAAWGPLASAWAAIVTGER